METDIIKNAKAEIETILKKYNVVLLPTVVHQGTRTFAHIEIVEATPVEDESVETTNPA